MQFHFDFHLKVLYWYIAQYKPDDKTEDSFMRLMQGSFSYLKK